MISAWSLNIRTSKTSSCIEKVANKGVRLSVSQPQEFSNFTAKCSDKKKSISNMGSPMLMRGLGLLGLDQVTFFFGFLPPFGPIPVPFMPDPRV